MTPQETDEYQIIQDYLEKIKTNQISASQSIKKLVKGKYFFENLKTIDSFFFNNVLKDINTHNYEEVISLILKQHKSENGNPNDFNIWSRSKNEQPDDLIEQHENINKRLGFRDNGNGIYKSFLGKKNLISFIEKQFGSNSSISNSKEGSYASIDINKTDLSLNTILYGPPGTGKTYKLKEEYFKFFTDQEPPYSKRYVFTTFHQSYSYEDFIEGIKPIINKDNKTVLYDVIPGVFKELVDKAKKDEKKDYAIFIDEINRGNIANIFGELITLIEVGKRLKQPQEIKVKLPYSNEPDFGVPNNLYIIGTMNSADRSVEALDSALRRRFTFIEMNPRPELLSKKEFKCSQINLELLLKTMNLRIEKLLDSEYCIGHSYFMSIKDKKNPLADLKQIFKNEIFPLLQEYFYGDWGKILLVVGEEFIEVKGDDVAFLSADKFPDIDDYEEKVIYQFTDSKTWSLGSFRSIYE